MTTRRTPAIEAGGQPPAAAAVETTMYRALAVLRVVLLLNALFVNWYRWEAFDHPVAGLAVLTGMVAWTAFTIWAYDAPSRRRPPLLIADLAVCLGAVLASPWLKGEDMRATVPGFWISAVILAWAIRWGWRGGLVASLAAVAADLSVRADVTQCNYGNLFLLAIAGPVLGFCVGLLVEMATARDAAERAAAAAAERQRLSRAVHDGVLQVLALVQRRGEGAEGEDAELGRLAGEQEAALRALVQQQARPLESSAEQDLMAALAPLAVAQVSLAGPAEPVLLPSPVVEELVAAVGACLSNVRHHVGREAPAWILVEDLADRVVVTVRDEGPGIGPGRLEEARGDGRLGVAQSIRGRIEDLGGTAELRTAPGQGTEWEFTVWRERGGE